MCSEQTIVNIQDRLSEFKFIVGGAGGNGGEVSGSLKGRDAAVHMIDLSAPPYNLRDRWAEQTYAYIALHEIIHLAGVQGGNTFGYGDYELANAAHDLPGAEKVFPVWHSDKNGNNIVDFSKYWDAELHKHCKFQ